MTTSVIFLVSQKVIMQCDVYAVELFTYISNKSKYLKTEMRYAIAVKTNLYNFKSSLKNKRVSFKHIFSFHIYPLINRILGKVYWLLPYAHNYAQNLRTQDMQLNQIPVRQSNRWVFNSNHLLVSDAERRLRWVPVRTCDFSKFLVELN